MSSSGCGGHFAVDTDSYELKGDVGGGRQSIFLRLSVEITTDISAESHDLVMGWFSELKGKLRDHFQPQSHRTLESKEKQERAKVLQSEMEKHAGNTSETILDLQ